MREIELVGSGDVADAVPKFEAAADKFARAVAALAEIEGMKAENAHRAATTGGVSYGEDAFYHVNKKYGLEVEE